MRTAVLCALSAVIAPAACVPPPEPPAGWHQVYLTRDGADVVQVRNTAAATLRADGVATNIGTNSRSVLWQPGQASADHAICTHSVQSRHSVQEGVAVRVAASARGNRSGTRAITVTKNVWAGVHQIYNVHLWDNTTADTPSGLAGFSLVASVDMSGAVTGGPAGAGRHLCARVSGTHLEWKVWSAGKTEPAWDDPAHSARTRVPRTWVYEGRPGTYIGHLGARDWAAISLTAPAEFGSKVRQMLPESGLPGAGRAASLDSV